MASRLLREQANAFNQRMALTESRVRALNLRAWPGAVRTERSLALFEPPGHQTSQMLSLTVPAGRWLASATATIVTAAVTPVPEVWTMTLSAEDLASGEDVAFDNPPAYMWLPANPNGDEIWQSMSLGGDLVADESARVILSITNSVGRYFVVVEPRLRMLPV